MRNLPTRRRALLTLTAPLMAQERDYDESKVRHSPDALVMANGERVTSPAAWEHRRRPELLRLFEANVYGRAPGRPRQMHFAVTSADRNALDGIAERKLIAAYFDNGKNRRTLEILLYLPKNHARPAPVFVGLNFRGNHTISHDPGIPLTANWVSNDRGIRDHKAIEATRGMQADQWPVERLLARGYGLATIYAGDLCPDFEGGLVMGVPPLFYRKGQSARYPDEWGAIGAWAWGLRRVMDYLETERAVDRRRVAVMGHSRMGKTALWAGARDARFRIVISNCSGAGGATLARRRFGESVKDLATRFPWWFCANYQKFEGHEDALPIDQHELLALSAPRPMYVAVADQDLGSDPRGQFLSCVNAAPVYRLLGTDGFGATEMPPLHRPVMSTIGFHIRAGRHDVTAYDWDRYMDFAGKFMPD